MTYLEIFNSEGIYSWWIHLKKKIQISTKSAQIYSPTIKLQPIVSLWYHLLETLNTTERGGGWITGVTYEQFLPFIKLSLNHTLD